MATKWGLCLNVCSAITDLVLETVSQASLSPPESGVLTNCTSGPLENWDSLSLRRHLINLENWDNLQIAIHWINVPAASCFNCPKLRQEENYNWNSKMKWLWRVLISRRERERKNSSKYCKISVFGLKFVARNMKGWLKICTSYLVNIATFG